MSQTTKLSSYNSQPVDWEDDVKMTVMFSPFRDRNLNPKSWEQKVKFWSESILNDCVECKTGLVEVSSIREKFRRKGKAPSCLETVVQEMISNGQLQKLSDFENKSSDGWFSWGYKKLLKEPIGWSLKMFPWKQIEQKTEETYVIVDVIKSKANELIEIRQRLVQDEAVNIVEYSDLQEQHQDLCQTDTEFSLVMQELCNTKQVVIQQSDHNTKLVKFIQKETKHKEDKINEQDLHIHRIQKAQTVVKKELEALSTEVQRLRTEALTLKKQGAKKMALSALRKSKLVQTRIDKLTGSMDTLEEILYRIKQAESNEMILRAIEGGTSVLKDITGKTSPEDVASAMDELADLTQTYEDITTELSSQFTIDEPSQSELEDELTAIMEGDALGGNHQPPISLDNSDDLDIEKELEDILKDDGTEIKQTGGDLSGLDEMLGDLQLPDVPTHSPAGPTVNKKQALISR